MPSLSSLSLLPCQPVRSAWWVPLLALGTLPVRACCANNHCSPLQGCPRLGGCAPLHGDLPHCLRDTGGQRPASVSKGTHTGATHALGLPWVPAAFVLLLPRENATQERPCQATRPRARDEEWPEEGGREWGAAEGAALPRDDSAGPVAGAGPVVMVTKGWQWACGGKWAVGGAGRGGWR